MTQKPFVELVEVTKNYPGVVAMDAVSIQFFPGEVHAVIGENGAGKSTMMNVLAGEIQPNGGRLRLDDVDKTFPTPLASQAAGIRVVYQELSLCWNLSVGENVILPELAGRKALSPLASLREGRAAVPVLERLGLGNLSPESPVEKLSVAQQQMVEIARAVNQNARMLVLDEPNSALSPDESEKLFEVVRSLRAEGVSVVYVSHHLEEVLALADQISVMRDGKLVSSFKNTPDVTTDTLVAHMVGRDVSASDQYSTREGVNVRTGPAVLELHNLNVQNVFENVTFDVSAGEILGVSGLPDSGKDLLADAIFGIVSRSGEVQMKGIRIAPNRPRHAIASGMAYIPADRRGAGALLSMSVAENTVASALGKFLRRGFLNGGSVRKTTEEYIAKFDTKVSALGQAIATLSGGNQQKIILSRGLVTAPDLLILHEPTRGIDVGAKAEIYDILKDLASDGMAILMISSELPEIVLHTSRVLVMADGLVTGQLSGAEITEENIMALATRSRHHAA
ncbi:sugar ABC transporter ATP-binding protein [Roseobacter sp. N2S]|uniref:sugar ABC transporter ATP-binding protein n=1 Tax=Roseobacter sp. N2S TaxID=2663844 RepID=UPI00285A427F|nr:sugar ABC transporter ATP-binding protein [Roseobacter sp. N2S]MDR6266044.1 ABC-type sugar transport system ATPase subunit [Roseobacter sp. N2S]